MNGFEAKALAGQEYVEYINTCSDEELKVIRKEFLSKSKPANLGLTPPLADLEKAKGMIALRESVGRSARKALKQLQKEKENELERRRQTETD